MCPVRSVTHVSGRSKGLATSANLFLPQRSQDRNPSPAWIRDSRAPNADQACKPLVTNSIPMPAPTIQRLMALQLPFFSILFAAAVAKAATDAAGPPRVAKGARAEVQIALCAPPDRIVRALDLRPSGAPLEVWQFDDSALTLFARGLRLRLRVAEDGGSELTLKVADQDCAKLDPSVRAAQRGQVRIRCIWQEFGGRRVAHASPERKEHQGPAVRSPGAGGGAESSAVKILAQSRQDLAIAAGTSRARSDAGPDIPNQGKALRHRYVATSGWRKICRDLAQGAASARNSDNGSHGSGPRASRRRNVR